MLANLLASRPWLLADGATGTNLFEMGLTSGDAPELWLEAYPERIESLHKSFVDAGADIILTNTFGCNGRRLMLHKAAHQAAEWNALAARIARKAAQSAGRSVVIAGSVGPTGDLLFPLGELTEEQAVDVFIEQILGLKAGGADVIWIETMSAEGEMRAAAQAAARVGMPFTVTASFDTAGRTMMGITPQALGPFLLSFEPKPLAIGANCGVGASDTLAAIAGLLEASPEAVVIAKANAGIPVIKGEHVHYSGDPDLMAAYACLALDAGARIIGGCCGTSPRHLAAMHRALSAHVKGEPPALETVVAALGPLVSPPATPKDGPKREHTRKRGSRA